METVRNPQLPWFLGAPACGRQLGIGRGSTIGLVTRLKETEMLCAGMKNCKR